MLVAVFRLTEVTTEGVEAPWMTSTPLMVTEVPLFWYSTRVAFRVLVAYRQASSRVQAWVPTKSSLPTVRPASMAREATLTVQLVPVKPSMELS